MYVGRIVAVGRTPAGQMCGLYRVSSRSFPNRRAAVQDDRAGIIPKAGFEDDIFRNPYIAYNCLRILGSVAVVSNGSQTDILADKLSLGMPPRDALVTVLHAMDYEHDSLNTPRIAGIVNAEDGSAWLGIVTDSSLLVHSVDLPPGSAVYVATYEHTDPNAYRDTEFNVEDATGACQHVMGGSVFGQLERPVTAVCAVAKPGNTEYEIDALDATG